MATEGGASGIQPVLDTDGRLLTALADIHRAWGEHFGRLAADSTGNSQDAEHWRHLDPHPQGPHLESLDESLTREDLWTALKKMRSYRAPGGDGIPTELLRGCLKEEPPPWLPDDAAPPTTHMTDSMLRLANFAYEKGLVAGPWVESIVVSIPKKGDLADMNNYRGISLMATVLKLVCVVISDRVNDVAEERGLFSRAQAGFRRKEECVTQVAMVMEVIQRRRLAGRPTFAVFVDLKKAYDMVPHEALFAKLSRFGIRGRCLKFLRRLYGTSTIRVRVGGGAQALYSDLCQLLRGVRQGCPLSPLLFNIFIDDLPDGTTATGAQVPIGCMKTWRASDIKIGCALFADDAIGICPTLNDAVAFCDQVTEWCAANEMAVGIGKCGIMEFLPDGYDVNDHECDFDTLANYHALESLQMSGQAVPLVEEYLYLGIRMTPTLDLPSMINHRIKAGKATVATLLPFLRCPVLPMSMRLRTVQGVILPRLLFGAELYGMNRALTNKMQVIQNRAVSAVVGMTRRSGIPSVGLWAETRIPPICARAAAWRARAYRKGFILKTWLAELVRRPFKSRCWTWCSGTARWINRFARPHATEPMAIDGWREFSSERIKLWVQQCIVNREEGIRCAPGRATTDATTWYEKAAFKRLSLTRARVGGGLKDQAGLALIVRCQLGGFPTAPLLVEWKRIPLRFATRCPFCGRHGAETLEHIVFVCVKWRAARLTHVAGLIAEVVSMGPASVPGFGQQRLSWFLGGSHGGRRVRGWIPPKLTRDPDPTDATKVAGSDSDYSVDSARSGEPNHLDEVLCGAIRAARFLIEVARLRACIIRSRWGEHHRDAQTSEVPTNTTGQRPDG